MNYRTTQRRHRSHSLWVEVVGGIIALVLAFVVGFVATDDDDDDYDDDDRQTSQYEEYDD